MNMGKILGIIIGATIAIIFLAYLMAPVIAQLIGDESTLDPNLQLLIGVVPVVVVICIIVAVVAPLMGKRGM